MATGTSRNLQISPETDADLRQFLKSRGDLTEKLSRFVEEAVQFDNLDIDIKSKEES